LKLDNRSQWCRRVEGVPFPRLSGIAAPYSQAEGDWIGRVGSDYVAFATAEADYDAALTDRLAELESDYAGHFVTFAGAAAGEAAAYWANSTSQWLSYEEGRIGREDSALSGYSTSDQAYGVSAAQGSRQHAIDTATAQKSYDIALYQGPGTAESGRDAALAAAQQAYDTALAEANLAWTTGAVGAETSFLTDEATGMKDLAVAVAGLDKTYTVRATAHRDYQITESTAAETLATAKSTASATRQSASAAASVTRAAAEDTAATSNPVAAGAALPECTSPRGMPQPNVSARVTRYEGGTMVILIQSERSPAATLPRNSQFFRPMAICFINCSVSLLSMGILPSPKYTCSASH